jgi:hypothetical protein
MSKKKVNLKSNDPKKQALNLKVNFNNKGRRK